MKEFIEQDRKLQELITEEFVNGAHLSVLFANLILLRFIVA